MKTMIIIWFSMVNGVATDSVQSKDFESLTACETYGTAIMHDAKAEMYKCIEGYSFGKGK